MDCHSAILCSRFIHVNPTVPFNAALPHHFANHGKEEAAMLAIVSAGLRRS